METQMIALHNGQVLQVHAPTECRGEFCCIHKPSDHPLRDAPLNWRGDRQIMERICTHGVGHPDPDGIKSALAFGRYVDDIHGCCGYSCCFDERLTNLMTESNETDNEI